MPDSYDKGDLIEVEGQFKRVSDGELFDPTTVKFAFKKPGAATVTYEHGVDAELTKDSVGVYQVELDLDTSGNWHYRMYAEGTGQTAAEGSVHVRDSNV